MQLLYPEGGKGFANYSHMWPIYAIYYRAATLYKKNSK